MIATTEKTVRTPDLQPSGGDAWLHRSAVDIIEREDEFIVLTDAPADEPGSVEIGFEAGVLTIDASAIGGVRSRVRLDGAVDAQRASTWIADGVLEVRAPKARRSANSMRR